VFAKRIRRVFFTDTLHRFDEAVHYKALAGRIVNMPIRSGCDFTEGDQFGRPQVDERS
jgi:hypothetical protein